MIFFLLVSLFTTSQASVVDLIPGAITKCNGGIEHPDAAIIIEHIRKPMPDASRKCIYHCIAEETKIFTDGRLDIDVGQSIFKEVHSDKPELLEKSPNLMRECSDSIKTDDGCEYTYELMKCLEEGIEKII